ncbi:phosphate acyltransferase PlsX [Compostibacter hankyongensis]|uniref:Phosphate acyltransferase n=1 Tax=Compostibacter hankyongensis TaxID=1007089 RepID=A0ABP8FPA6_9BACT
MMVIGLDMMGGDFAPREAVNGVKLFLDKHPSPAVHLALIGDQAQVQPLLDEAGIDASRYRLIHAPEVIGMHEHPTKALKEKIRSSINTGLHLLKEGKIQAFISAGNTGAVMVGALYSIKSMPGIQRPTISTLVPREDGSTGLLLDVGVNADCKPEHLVQFAILGTLYAKNILKVADPGVGLLNIGEEEGKGNLLSQSAYPLLRDNNKIRFVGNIEGRDLFSRKADVIVCDGFTGNIVLKMAESVYDIMNRRQIRDEYFELFNYEYYGGTPVLGVNEPVIIGHGISKGSTFEKMISLAGEVLETRLLDKFRENFTPAKD